MVIRPAADVHVPDDYQSPKERKALDALRDSFKHDGATRTEWFTACTGMAQSTFYRVADKLTDKRLVQSVGSRYRLTAGGMGIPVRTAR